jgi:hypothetical protein
MAGRASLRLSAPGTRPVAAADSTRWPRAPWWRSTRGATRGADRWECTTLRGAVGPQADAGPNRWPPSRARGQSGADGRRVRRSARSRMRRATNCAGTSVLVEQELAGETEVDHGDACALPEYMAARRYDVTFSKSVNEHVGGHERRLRFAQSCTIHRDRREPGLLARRRRRRARLLQKATRC